LPRDAPASIGKTDSHVVIRVGPWTTWLEVQTKLRFPDVDRILPGPGDHATRLALDPGDARFLLDSLGRLPGANEPNAPATLDLNGKVAVRARAAGDGPATELVLPRSSYSGPPVRLQTNREFLARAIRLGFAAVEVVDADSPLACRDGRRVLAWQPLSKDSAIEGSDGDTRIEPGPGPVAAIELTPNHAPRPRFAIKPPVGVDDPTPPADPGPSPGGLATLIAEAEALHDALADARSRAGRLVVALRKQKRRERLVAATLASLRQLRLQDVAD